MIAIAKPTKTRQYTDEEVHAKFLELMPLITRIAKGAFKNYSYDRKADAVQSVLIAAFINIKQLAAEGRLEEAYATPIARFGIYSYRTGRPAGVKSDAVDVFGERCQYLGRSRIKHCGLASEVTDSFESEATATDARYPVHKTVQIRIDFFQTWYRNQSPKDQEIIYDLAMGETTTDLAKKHKVTLGAVSQWRRKYAKSWNDFINPQDEIEAFENIEAPV